MNYDYYNKFVVQQFCCRFFAKSDSNESLFVSYKINLLHLTLIVAYNFGNQIQV